MRVVEELQKFLAGRDGVFRYGIPTSFRARQFLISNGQQTLGVAMPWGIAATLVRPHEKVLPL